MRPGCVVGFFLGGLAMAYWLFFVAFALALVQQIHPSGVVDGSFELGYFLSLYLPPIIFAFSLWIAFRRPRNKSYADD
jgi:ABC-type Fe3+ transport system permease subunit